MSYKSLVHSNVRKAFNLLKDLADDVILTKKSSTGFDFGTGEAVLAEAPSVTTKAIVTEMTTSQGDKTAKKKMVLLKTEDVGDITSYDTLTTNSETWKIGPLITTDRFVTVAELIQ
jgi:hypothetical protein